MLTGSYIIVQGRYLSSCFSSVWVGAVSIERYKPIYYMGECAFMFDGSKATVKDLKAIHNHCIRNNCILYVCIGGKLMNVNTGSNHYPCFLQMTEVGNVIPCDKVGYSESHLSVDGKTYKIVKER